MMILGSISWESAASIAALVGVAVAALTLLVNSRAQTVERAAGTRDMAREEALELATVRGQAITDLQTELATLKTEVAEERDAHLAAVDRLQKALDLARDQALETQQMLAHGMRGLLVWILRDLEHEPPRVDVAVRRLREALDDPDPRAPGQRRAA